MAGPAACRGGRVRPAGPGEHRPGVPDPGLGADDRAGPVPAPAPGPDPGVLRQLRLALVRGDALGSGPAAEGLPGRGTRGRDQGRARHPVHPGRPAPGGRVRRDERNRLAALRLGLGAHPHPRAGGLARRRGRPALDRGHGAAGRRIDGELPGLAAQGHLPDPDRAARQQLVHAVPGAAVRAAAGRKRAPRTGPGHRGGRTPLVRRRHGLSRPLGAVRQRLPVTRADRGRAHGPAAAAGAVHRMARSLPARPGRGGAGRVVHARSRLGFQRRAGRAPARSQPQPRLVLAAAGRDPARRGSARPGVHGRHAGPRRGVPAARGRRPLHGHPLAGRLRRPAVQLTSGLTSPAAITRVRSARATGW